MSFAKVFSAQTALLDAHIIDVEVDLSQGLHSYTTVGLPDKAVEESRDRVSAALQNADFKKSKNFKPPKHHNRKITVSLAPADIKKEGPLFDVPIALAYLLAAEEIAFDSKGKLFIGELSLDGSLRSVRGVLSVTQKGKNAGFNEIFVPLENADEASLIDGILVYGVSTLSELIAHLNGSKHLKPYVRKGTSPHARTTAARASFDDIRGQAHAKRGLIIAAAGGHNIALYGPPGTGKTLLAQALVEILPELAHEDALEVTSIHSVAGNLKEPFITTPPFRSPHHTSSYVSIVGGGTVPKPGEATLAHHGVLFLDEFPEFDRRVINALREPLEDGVVSIARAKGSAVFPSRFILVAAMNPCPCGHYGTGNCTCTPSALVRYRQKLSGPIVDRIDMWFEVSRIPHEELSKKRVRTTTESDEARNNIAAARAHQAKRFTGTHVQMNSRMGVKELERFVPLDDETTKTLNEAATRMDLSPRAYHRIIKLSRTIADLEDSRFVGVPHILEALSYRAKEMF